MVKNVSIRYSSFSRSIWLILSIPTVVCFAVMLRTPYTEIDWQTYLQQVDKIRAGARDYFEIYGDTGPLVYPAGHVYLFAFLNWLTGTKVFHGQVIFAFFYVLTSFLVVSNGMFSGIPTLMLLWSTLSRRTISIYVLRLFNDAPCTLLLHLCVYFFIRRKWALGCVFLSLAVSIKMSALLIAPGVLYILLSNVSRSKVFVLVFFVCGGIQLVIGLPFILTYPKAYISKAFELSRTFDQKWTVNYQFLPEVWFHSKLLSISLLLLTISTYYWFSRFVWPRCSIIQTLYISNFIGVVFARTLHYQFYAWYSFTLPALAYWGVWSKSNSINWVVRVAILLGIELCYNYPTIGQNPATPFSSLLVHALHFLLLYGLVK